MISSHFMSGQLWAKHSCDWLRPDIIIYLLEEIDIFSSLMNKIKAINETKRREN